MTIIAFCYTTMCSIALSNVDYKEHLEVTWVEITSKLLLSNVENAALISAKMKAMYEKDLIMLLDNNVYDIVAPTLISVKRAVKEAKKEGKHVGMCYMRTEELIQNEAEFLFDEKMRGCLDTYRKNVLQVLNKVQDILNKLNNMMNEVDNVRANCARTASPTKCAKKKMKDIQNVLFPNVSKKLNNVEEKIRDDYNKVLDDAYNCTSDMRTSLEEIMEPAMQQGLGCIENPEMAEYSFSRSLQLKI